MTSTNIVYEFRKLIRAVNKTTKGAKAYTYEVFCINPVNRTSEVKFLTTTDTELRVEGTQFECVRVGKRGFTYHSISEDVFETAHKIAKEFGYVK